MSDFPEDYELEPVTLEELEQERAIDVELDQRSEDYYLPPEVPLIF